MYANYDFYKTEYLGTLTADQFDKFCMRASVYLDNCLADVDESTINQQYLGFCVCELTDAMANAESGGNRQIKAVSNDGYSETYELTDPETQYINIVGLYFPNCSDGVVKFI